MILDADHALKNPCRACALAGADKNGPACLHCGLRLDYVRALGGHFPSSEAAGPALVESGTASARKHVSPLRPMTRGIYTGREIGFIRQNARAMTDEQLALAMGRTAASIQRQRVVHGIRRHKGGKMPFKICKRCGANKERSEFYGTDTTCKPCRNKYNAERQRRKRMADDPPQRERERENSGSRWAVSSSC